MNKSKWTAKKVTKKGIKYLIFFLLSFTIANTFLAYIIGIDKLIVIITDPPSEHISGLISILIFTGAFYFVFAWFREQACILVCPYGRLQSVLLNKNSIVIAYDFIRGEPRGKLVKRQEEMPGDCIDCKQCLHVCPTGIDIRNGTQLECVNCTACIDACDSIMDKVKRPRGLIRYDSLEGIKNKDRKRFTARVIGYSITLMILITTTTVLMASRSLVDVDILRTPGMLYQNQADNKVSNLYNIKIHNKTFKEIGLELKLSNIEGELKVIGENHAVAPGGSFEGSLLVILPKEKIKLANTPVEIEIYSDGSFIGRVSTTFLGPVN